MSLDIRWLVPAAIYAFAPQCIAAKYMSVEQARALIFPFADEFVINPVQLTPGQMQHELITYALGINADGSIRQVEIVEYLEAYGSQVRYPNWREQFVGKTADSLLRVDSDITNISGATLSVRHLTDGIKRLLFLHRSVLR